MKYALVNALNKEGKPLYINGNKKGVVYDFEIPRDVLICRVPDSTTMTQQQKLSQHLKRVIRVPVLIVDSRIEFLVLETPRAQRVRLFFERVTAFWYTLRAKFALSRAKP